jgi:hypothetical protein
MATCAYAQARNMLRDARHARLRFSVRALANRRAAARRRLRRVEESSVVGKWHVSVGCIWQYQWRMKAALSSKIMKESEEN